MLGIEIKDHIDELKAKDSYMKALDIPKGDNEFRRNFEKECIDLYLLFAIHFSSESGQKKVEDRIENIISKIKKDRN